MKKLLCIGLLTALLLSLLSCGAKETCEETSFWDDLGRPISLSAEDRVAACHSSFADCWLLAGGTLVGVTDDAVKDHGLEVGDASIIGTAKTVYPEALVASGATVALLSADLTAHLELEETLKSLGITCAYFKVDTFSDYASVMRRFCDVTGRQDLYERHVSAVEEKIEAIRSRIPKEETRTVLLMRAYSSGIKAKSDDNLAGLILKEFGFRNLADAHPSLLEDMSLEHIVSADPDYILVLTMGNEAAARKYLAESLEQNPAFTSLEAVREGRYVVLPKELFHYKPNERWDESYEYLAKLLYPTVLVTP